MIQRALAVLPDEPEYALSRAACLTRSSELGFYDYEPEPMIADARAALRVLATSPVASPVQRIDALNALAFGYFVKNDLDEADRAYAELMATIEKIGRENTLAAAEALTNWGMVHSNADIVKAEPLWRRALELDRAISGPDEVTPIPLFNVGFALGALARYEEAERFYEEAVRNARARKDDRIRWGATMMLADLHTESGELSRAAADLDKIPGEVRDRASFKYSRGILDLAIGDARSARGLLTESVQLAFTTGSSVEVYGLIALSRAEQSLGNTAAALTAAQEALAAAVTYAPRGTPSHLTGRAEEQLGEAELASGDFAAARLDLCKAIEQLDLSLGAGHPLATRALRVLDSIPSSPSAVREAAAGP